MAEEGVKHSDDEWQLTAYLTWEQTEALKLSFTLPILLPNIRAERILNMRRSLRQSVLRTYGCLDSSLAPELETAKLSKERPANPDDLAPVVCLTSKAGNPWAAVLVLSITGDLDFTVKKFFACYDFEGCVNNPFYDYTWCWENLFDIDQVNELIQEEIDLWTET